MEQSSLFGDGVDIDTETPATAEATAPTDARAQAAARAAELRHELDYHAYRYYMLDCSIAALLRSISNGYKSTTGRNGVE